MRWAKGFHPVPARVFVVHGESAVCDVFAALVKNDLGCGATVPDYSGSWDLIADREIEAGLSLRPSVKKSKLRTHSPSYIRLLAVQQRLSTLVGRAGGWPNRDLTKLTDQLLSLCVKSANKYAHEIHHVVVHPPYPPHRFKGFFAFGNALPAL
jgi:metallo-beta-lactamase family protein